MADNKPTTAALQAHCEALTDQHEITWLVRPGRKAYALRVAEEIRTPPIRGVVSYAAVLHEIGHILGRHQDSSRVMVREGWAWKWARRNALIWTAAMEHSAQSALDWYRPRAATIDAAWQPDEWGGQSAVQ